MTGKNQRCVTSVLLLGTLAVLAWCAGTAGAADAADVQKCRFTILGDLKMKLQGMTTSVTADTRVKYTLSRKGAEVTATLDGLDLTAKQDGREMMHAVQNKERMLVKQQGRVVKDVTRDKAEAEDKQKMDDLFSKPLMTYTIDKNGKELKRALTTAAGAKEMIDVGMASNLRLFHPPFPADKDKWQAPSEISMGNKALVKGELTYEKVKPAEGAKQIKVKVSGQLTNKEAKQGPVTVKDVVYKVKGEQTYDLERKQWVSGKLVMDVSFTLEAGGMQLGTASGDLTATLAALPVK